MDNRRMERGRCEADFLMKFQADRRRGGGKKLFSGTFFALA